MARMNLPSTDNSDVAAESRLLMQNEARAKLESLIKEQGVKALDIELLRTMSTVWPEDETVDEFLAARDHWRGETTRREIPLV